MRGTDWTPEGLRSFVDKIAEHHDAGRLPFALHLAGGNEEQLIDIFQTSMRVIMFSQLIVICTMHFFMVFLLKRWKEDSEWS